MTRTTLNIDESVLRELRRGQQHEQRPLGELVSQLLAAALADSSEQSARSQLPPWRTAAMGARIDLDDKGSVDRIFKGE